MRLDLHQHMKMTQQMKLAPRMIQSMEILQLPVMQLEERLRQEVEQNATLEVSASTAEQPNSDLDAGYDDGHEPPEGAAAQPAETIDTLSTPSDQEYEAYEQIVEEWNENAYSPHQPSRAAGAELADKRYEAMQNMEDRPTSLGDHLFEQLTVSDEEPIVVDFARYLVANLDNHGFLNAPFDELKAAFETPLTPSQAELGLLLVQGLEPTGVGARDLRECLMLQLEEPPAHLQHVEALRTLVKDHLDDIAHNRLPLIEKRSGLPRETIREAIHDLRHLILNPAAKFASTSNQYVVPDVAVEKGDNGAWKIITNEQNIPHVRISKHYLDMLRQKQGDAKTLEYVKRKITSARWLIDAIEQRRNTLEKVTRAIVDHQSRFLEKGPEAIEPLKMQQIADKVGVHVTTVSRAVDDKWIATPRGIFPLKKFFGGGTTTTSGEEVAWDIIKRKLTELIAAEEKSNPLSDDEIVLKLGEQGYPLARRTVTKYRKMLNIPSSRQRKVHF